MSASNPTNSASPPLGLLRSWARETAIRLGLKEPIERLREKAQARVRKRWWVRRFRDVAAGLDRDAVSKQISAVVLTVDPSSLLDECLAALEKQTLPPGHIEIVRNVSPASKAVQEGSDRVHTPFYTLVDEDMVLAPTCLEHLYAVLTSRDDCAEALACLQDPIMGVITGVRMYRTEVVRAIGFHPLEGEKGWDRKMNQTLQEQGYASLHCELVEGDHHPRYEPYEIFWKYRFISEKLRHYRRAPAAFEEHVDMLVDHWKRSRDPIALYGLAGLFEGLQTEDPSQELTYEGRLEHPALQGIRDFLEDPPR